MSNPFPISIWQEILASLMYEEGKVYAIMLTRKLNRSQNSIKEAVYLLEQAGLIYKIQEGNRNLLYLTDTGKKIAKECYDIIVSQQCMNDIIGYTNRKEYTGYY